MDRDTGIHGCALEFKLGDVSSIGLGATRLIDPGSQVPLNKMGATSPLSLSVLSMTARLAIPGIFFICGYLGIRRHLKGFILEICLYTLDVLVFILMKDYFPLILHTEALIALSRDPGLIIKLGQADDFKISTYPDRLKSVNVCVKKFNLSLI